MNCNIPLHLANGKTYLAIFVPFVLVLALVVYMHFAGKAPTTLKKAGLGVVVLVNMAAVAFFVWQVRSAQVGVGSDTLTLRAGTGNVTVPLSAVLWEEAVDATAIRFPLRKRGTSLPGMHAGWFRKEGGGDAFLLRSSEPSTLIPTTNKFDVVIPTTAYEQARQCAFAPKQTR
jgi:hypothetical protein